ncbi:hypothetical protein LT85_1950 [Collimonas arenae]|uniref:Uncharacterized protein n=1 Tax=Collimonas arenae TaxID=279058 RepID=A0A0A1F8P4_9BURK|nr:hypothetical protein [Collimonas arenae]AIY41108.1 hypothetical protein LT85_1950 [Collimonas arenae]
MRDKKNISLSLVIVLVLAACGGGDEGSVSPAPVPVATAAGKAVDGYLGAASVLCDTNNNGVADAGEVTAITDMQGNFTFSPACASPMVVSGGTSIDTGLSFRGLLTAPFGSVVVTPLTSLMANGGLTAIQVASALGLPAGTDVTRIDPAAKNANGGPLNANLLKSTLAMQQIIQQVADTLGSLAQNTSPSAIQAIYSEVGKAVVTTLTASSSSQLIDGSGSVSPLLASGIVLQSVTNIATTANPVLDGVKDSIGAYSPVSVSALISGAVATEATTLAQSSDAALADLTKSLQSNPTIANATFQLAALLTTSNQNKVDLTNLNADLAQLVGTSSANAAAAGAAVLLDTSVQAGRAGIPVPSVTVSSWSQPSNYLAIQNDSIKLDGNSYTLSQFMSGVTLTQKPSLIDTISLGFIVNGAPIPKNGSGAMTTRISLGAELTDTGNSGRVLQFILDQADVTVDSNQQLSISVPAGAKLYIYSRTSHGVGANMTLPNVTAKQFVSIANNELTFSVGNILQRIFAAVQAQSSSSGQATPSLQNITGTFNLKLVVSNLAIQSQESGAVTGFSIMVGGSNQPAVNGQGIQGIFTVH